MARDDIDDIHAFEAKETAGRLPWGWVALFWGLILWGIYYAWTYTPPRWSQEAAYEKSAEAAAGAVVTSGTNILATVFFTALATTVAVVLLVSVSRKRAPKGG
jgi:hypothetical protein